MKQSSIKYLVFTIISFLNAHFTAEAQDEKKLYFHNLQVEDGMSQNMIYAIHQDHNGYMWFGTQDGLNRYDGTRIRTYQWNPEEEGTLGNNSIFTIKEDQYGILWIGTMDGVYLYDEKTDQFSLLSIKDQYNLPIEGIIRDIEFDPGNTIWIAGLNTLYQIRDTICKSFPCNQDREKEKNISFRDLACDSYGNIWIATYESGLLRFCDERFYPFSLHNLFPKGSNPNFNSLSFISPDTLLAGSVKDGVIAIDIKNSTSSCFFHSTENDGDHFIRSLFQCQNGNILIGTENGLFLKDKKKREIIHLVHLNGDPYSLSDNAIHSLYEDQWGGIWIGTFFGGVNYTHEYYEKFEKFYPINGTNSVSGKCIGEFCASGNQGIWIGTEDNGLNYYDIKNNLFYTTPIPARNIHALMECNDTLWVGTFSQGLYRWIKTTGEIRHWKNNFSENSIPDNSVYALFRDSRGILWMGFSNGLFNYDEHNNCFTPVLPNDLNYQINDIAEDKNGIIWVATWGNGVYAYDSKTQKWSNFKNSGPLNYEEKSLTTSLLIDSKGDVWVATAGAGFARYDRTINRFLDYYTTKNGLPNNVIYTLLEDSLHNIWGSTNKGIFTFNPANSDIQAFSHKNGLLGGQFNYKSGFCANNGKIYLGGIKGFVAFNPERLKQQNPQPKALITGLKIPGKNGWQYYSDNQGICMNYNRRVNFPYSHSSFAIEYTALDFMNPKNTMYAYKLKGLNEEWIYTETPYPVIYTDLSPGKYEFMVKASNNGKVWNVDPAILTIEILPPWYQTSGAYLFYFLITLILIGLLSRLLLIMNQKKNKDFQDQLERSKERELYQAKIDFFTNITHEIRTPLSLISAPLEEVLKKTEKDDPNRINLNIINKNTNRLLSLVNELLDLRKIENSKIGLNFQHVDMCQLSGDLISQFKPSLEKKGICLDYKHPDTPLYVDTDPKILAKILSNLLSNAWKHAKTLISINIELQGDTIIFQIQNDGSTISPLNADKIFEPFFKCDEKTEGTGIGLAFARAMTEMHGGTLLFSGKRDFVSFTLTLPLNNENVIDSGISTSADSRSIYSENILHEHAINEDKNKLDLIVVEDNEDFRLFLKHILSAKYRVQTACNGKEALDLLEALSPEIIISDLMMPVMDGLKFCNEIKTQLRFSHIPIVLLTAKTTLQSKIEGLKTGADAYIEKPFSVEHLLAQIENICENRNRLKESFKSNPDTGFKTLNLSHADDLFMSQVIQVIHDNISDLELDVEKLSATLNISRATLYRKLKTVSDQTPNDFIRLIRLKKGAQLLSEGNYRVNEISNIIGFNSASYFTKCFYKQFGVLPKNYQTRITSEFSHNY